MKHLTIGILVILPLIFIGQLKIDYDKNLTVICDTVYYNTQVSESNANQLVEAIDVVSGIMLNIRYATTNNFTEEKIYNSPNAFVLQPVGRALGFVQKKYGLRSIFANGNFV
ncbi:MAG: hypothetical protein HQ521_01595 [Bacteroidetes bacterium]|nr:hypothetical protein [Bacteroidota bacterium]